MGVFGILVRQFVLSRLRASHSRHRWLVAGLFVAGVGLAMLFLVSLAMGIDMVTARMNPPMTANGFVNRQILGVMLGLFLLRAVSQQSSRLPVRALIHLPLSRRRLVHFHQVSSIVSLHNLLPLFFAVPFWMRHATQLHGFWLSGVVLLLLVSQFLAVLLQTVLSTTRYSTWVSLCIIAVLVGLDQLAGLPYLSYASDWLFTQLGAGDLRPVLVLLGVAGALYAESSRRMVRSLNEGFQPYATTAVRALGPGFDARYGPVLNQVLLEVRLIWRHRRPRFYFLFSVVIAALYVAALLGRAGTHAGPIRGALAALFASGAFIFNYGQLMFSWDGQYFDGMLARAADLRQIVMAKVVLMVGSCLLLYGLTLPFFALQAPEHLDLHLAFGLYNAGFSTLLMLMLAMQNRKRVDLSRSSNLFNYQGFTVAHWIWFIFTTVPPVLIVWLLKDRPDAAVRVILGLGALSLVTMPRWVREFTGHFSHIRYEMASGFRQNEH